MAALQNYLRANLKTPLENGLDNETLASICQEFKIKVKKHIRYPNLLLFQYSNIAVDFSKVETRESRGIILDSDNNWKIISYPYDKFFNYGETLAAQIDWSNNVIYEKLDGCLMTMYYYDNQWLVSSSGKPDAGGLASKDNSVTLEDVFWKIWTDKKYTLPTDTEVCYIFEMLTDKNPVNIKYPVNDIILHGARNIISLQELSPKIIAAEYDWNCIPIHNIEINNKEPQAYFDSLLEFANSRSGTRYEGIVVCDKNFNRIKIKSKQYTIIAYSLNSLKNRPKESRKRLFELIVEDNINDLDELCTVLPELGAIAVEIKEQVETLNKIILDEYEIIKYIEPQKNFAEEAKKSVYSTCIYMMRLNKIKNPKIWFAQNGYDKFVKLLTNIKVNS